MNSISGEPSDLQILIQDYIGGTISRADLAILEDILRCDASAREQLRELAVLEEGLADFAASTNLCPAGVVSPITIDHQSSTHHNKWWVMSAAVVVTAAIAMAAFWLGQNLVLDNDPVPETLAITPKQDGPPDITYVAHVVEEIDSQFTNPELKTAVGFKRGSYELTNGSIHLRFINGADFILEAPAHFEILDDMNFRLRDGKLRAIIPPNARGIRVLTPGVDYHELEAEVGVFADSLEMRSDLCVFHGKASSSIPGSPNRLDVFDARQAVIYRNGVREDGVFDQSRFLKPGQIGLERWIKLKSELREHPDVIGYYTFDKTTGMTILNVAHRHSEDGPTLMPHGEIGSATWVAGRWPGKRSLMFEMERDYVELEIPGEYEQLTYAVWLKVDRLDHSRNSILCSDGWQAGAIHWELNRYGGPWVNSFASSCTVNIKNNVPIGKWIHLASTISTETRLGKTYLNGELVSEVQMSESTPLRPGECRLGNWFRHVAGQEQRGLKGRVDELIVLRRSLNQQEIRAIFQRGKPADHWNAR